MDLTEKAQKILTDVCERREIDIVQRWRSVQTVDEREQCSTDLRAVEELKELIEGYIRDDY